MATKYNHSLEKLSAERNEIVEDGGPSAKQTPSNESLPLLF